MTSTRLGTLVRRVRGRATQLAQRRHLAALHDPGLSLGQTQLELVPRGSHIQLHVRHEIRQVAPLSGRGFVLDLSRCSFVLDGIRCSRTSRVYQYHTGLVVEPAQGTDLPGAFIEYIVDWDRGTSGSADRLGFLQFPDDFPMPLWDVGHTEPVTGYPIPRWSVVKDELIEDVFVAGVPLRSLDDRYRPEPLLSGFILSEGLLADHDDPIRANVLVTRAGANLFANQYPELTRIATDAVSFLSSLFGWTATEAILVAGPGDRHISPPLSGGQVLHLDKQFSARYRIGSFGMNFEIVRELSSMYWGSGCRVRGSAGGELTAAIGAAVALWWAATHTDDEYVSQTSTAFGKLASRPRLLDYADVALGNMSSRLVGQLSQEMFQRLRDAHYRSKLARLTTEMWGMYVPYSAARRELQL